MSQFIFDDWSFDEESRTAEFRYFFQNTDYIFLEKVVFAGESTDYDHEVLAHALNLAHLLIGTSYFKTFPTRDIGFSDRTIDTWQASFLNNVYQEGLSQFAYENNLTRGDLANFRVSGEAEEALPYHGKGVVSLQSGGKDSLLVASLLKEGNTEFSSLYISSTNHYPAVIDTIGQPIRLVRRFIDREALKQTTEQGGRNGHVPVTFIVLAISLVQAVLDNKNTILSAIGHEGEEPHAYIGDLAVTHQWSKTWQAEQLFAEYVQRYISPDIRIGSPLRQYSELKIAELFVQKAWDKFGHSFSSCNVANYGQGMNNERLAWCGNCPKCANSYLLFAPFVEMNELRSLFGGQDLFHKAFLHETFKGLLGIDGIMKPFECVGEVDELRFAYHKALENGYQSLPFDVPAVDFDKDQEYPSQMIQL